MTKFAFVSAERTNHAVATLCRVVGASVSGFYDWLRAIPTVQTRGEAEAELRGHIGRIFAARGHAMEGVAARFVRNCTLGERSRLFRDLRKPPVTEELGPAPHFLVKSVTQTSFRTGLKGKRRLKAR